MKSGKNIEELKSDYMNIEIPNRLNDVVNDAISTKDIKNKRKHISKYSSLVASIVIVVGGVNLNPTLSNALENIPIIGSVVKVINFKNYRIDENGFDVSIDIPKIEGLKDKNLEYKMNSKFEQEGKQLYEEYLQEMENLKSDGIDTKESFKSWYEINTDNENILSIVVYNHYVLGSSNTMRKFYNIDKKNQTVLTLEGMFEGTDYIDIISENIKEQMREEMKKDQEAYYWIDTKEGYFDFEKIDKDQGFYINDKNEIVICFDKYDVAPGSEGLIEFTIPKGITDKLMK